MIPLVKSVIAMKVFYKTHLDISHNATVEITK